MGLFEHGSFVFTALSDFKAEDDPNIQLAKAREFGIRIIACSNLTDRDWRVIKGPFWRFQLRAKKLLHGKDPNEEYFIRRIEADSGSDIRIYYFDLKTQQDAMIEIRRKPGLTMSFRSGGKSDFGLDTYMMCSREGELCFLSNGDKFIVY